MRKLLAVVCAVALILSVSAPAFASSDTANGTDQEVVDTWGTTGKPSPGIWWTTDDEDDDDDDHHHKKSSDDSTGSENNDGNKVTDPNTSVWVPTMDTTGCDSMLAMPLKVEKAGALRTQIPALMNRASLDGLILVLTQTDGTVLYAKLADFGDTFDAANGAITIDFPAAGTCELLAPVA